MQKAEAQHNHAQPAVRQGKGASLESPQGERIAQLEAMVESSPQAGKQAQLAALLNNSSWMSSQRKTISDIHSSPNLTAQRQQLESLTGETAQSAEASAKPGAPIQLSGREGDEWDPGPGQGELAPPTPRPVQGGQKRPPLPETESLIQDGYSPRAGEERDETAQLVAAGESSQLRVTQCAGDPVKPNNTGLPDNLKNGIESLSGMSMDRVKVHYNSSQPAQLNALAYAQGSDIHVAPGQEQHLPHEAWHVVQQAQGRVRPTMQMKDGVPVNDDQGLEHEADMMGARAVNGVVQAVWQEAKPTPIVQKVDAEHGPKLKMAYVMASQQGAFNSGLYYQALNQLGYPQEDDACERDADAPMQFKLKTIQLARSPYAISGPKSYGAYNDILYQCDALGNIDFSAPSQYFLGNPYPGLNPVVGGSQVGVGAAVATYGTGNRYQHFKDANQQLPGFGGANGSSPAGLTWHHLSTHYHMHLVDRLVHSKHGHNGGVHIW